MGVWRGRRSNGKLRKTGENKWKPEDKIFDELRKVWSEFSVEDV
jgi:hypothetical protein